MYTSQAIIINLVCLFEFIKFWAVANYTIQLAMFINEQSAWNQKLQWLYYCGYWKNHAHVYVILYISILHLNSTRLTVDFFTLAIAWDCKYWGFVVFGMHCIYYS